MVESGSEVSYFIPEPINFAEVTREETLAKRNYEGDQKSNQQSEFSNSRAREGWACDYMHGCL